MTREYTPSARDPNTTFAANSNGTFATDFKANDGLVRERVYDATDHDFDTAGRLTWTRPAVGPWAGTVYDAASRVTESLLSANGSTTYLLTRSTHTHDAGGRLTVTSGTAVAPRCRVRRRA